MQTNRPDRLPWDLEQAMTAFQVHPSWYEAYWLTPRKQRPPGLIARIFRKASTALREARWGHRLAVQLEMSALGQKRTWQRGKTLSTVTLFSLTRRAKPLPFPFGQRSIA